jgi:hypothetical protein
MHVRTLALVIAAACGTHPDIPGNDAPKTPTPTPDASAPPPMQQLVTTIDPGVMPTTATIDQGTAIGQGSGNGATPALLANAASDPSNTQTVISATDPFDYRGTVPDTAAGFCAYSGPTPTRVSYVTGAKFETAADTDPMMAMAPFYFPLVYTSTNTPTDNAFGSQAPMLGLFDYRPKDIDEALVAAESDDLGKTWYFMQMVLELYPGAAGCPSSISGTNAHATSSNGSTADDGWGHAAIATTLANTTGTTNPVVAQQTAGLVNPDGIMAVFPSAPDAPAGTPVTVLYVQKILDGDTAFPAAQQCQPAPFSGKTNHDVSNVRLATTTDGIHFTDLGIASGLNDPTTVDYRGTRWIAPRATRSTSTATAACGACTSPPATASTATPMRSTTSATPSPPTK